MLHNSLQPPHMVGCKWFYIVIVIFSDECWRTSYIYLVGRIRLLIWTLSNSVFWIGILLILVFQPTLNPIINNIKTCLIIKNKSNFHINFVLMRQMKHKLFMNQILWMKIVYRLDEDWETTLEKSKIRVQSELRMKIPRKIEKFKCPNYKVVSKPWSKGVLFIHG